jgi:hypothetical protein
MARLQTKHCDCEGFQAIFSALDTSCGAAETRDFMGTNGLKIPPIKSRQQMGAVLLSLSTMTYDTQYLICNYLLMDNPKV